MGHVAVVRADRTTHRAARAQASTRANQPTHRAMGDDEASVASFEADAVDANDEQKKRDYYAQWSHASTVEEIERVKAENVHLREIAHKAQKEQNQKDGIADVSMEAGDAIVEGVRLPLSISDLSSLGPDSTRVWTDGYNGILASVNFKAPHKVLQKSLKKSCSEVKKLVGGKDEVVILRGPHAGVRMKYVTFVAGVTVTKATKKHVAYVDGKPDLLLKDFEYRFPFGEVACAIPAAWTNSA